VVHGEGKNGKNLSTNILLEYTNFKFHKKWKYWGLFGSLLNYYIIQLPLEE